MVMNVLKEAINKRLPVRFQYNKQGKVAGVRVGDPHAVFIMRKKDGSESTKVHIVQTDGVSDSEQELPSFRMFDIDELSEVSIVESGPQFVPSTKYNPEWEGYQFVIAKI